MDGSGRLIRLILNRCRSHNFGPEIATEFLRRPQIHFAPQLLGKLQLTVPGKASAIVQGAAAYQHLLDFITPG